MDNITKMPEYKPTKWQMRFCSTCDPQFKSISSDWCKNQKHIISAVDNIPFVVPDIQITHLGYKGWAYLKSNLLKQKYYLSPTNLENVIFKVGIGKNGLIENQWWIWCKVGSSFSLKVLV